MNQVAHSIGVVNRWGSAMVPPFGEITAHHTEDLN